LVSLRERLVLLDLEDITVGFPGGVCEKFDEACERAAASRNLAVQKATKERDKIMSSISNGRMKPSERIKAALEARRAGKVKAAEEQCEAACRTAEQELFKALDEIEAP
jgi:hypothetical protein